MDWLGFILSYILVFAFLALSGFLRTRLKLSDYVTRKIVHIGVSNWWFIAAFMIEDPVLASIGPITFIILNYLSYRFEIFKGMETSEKSNFGTVYFPISLLILVIVSYGGIIPKAAAGIGVLVMGYADGMASIVGRKIGKNWFGFASKKSLEGSMTFLLFALVVSLAYLVADPSVQVSVFEVFIYAFLIGCVGMLVEMITPFGLDNLSVPLITAVSVHTLVMNDYRLVLAILVNFAIAAAAFRKEAVSNSGFVAGVVVGSIIFVSSLAAYSMLMAFFITSSMMSRIGKSRKRVAMSVVEKGHKRDYVQVIANSGVGVVTSVLFGLTGYSVFLIATAICFATANADTWASEIGNLSPRNPVSIVNFKRIRKGLSGGVTPLGTLASLFGSLTIAVMLYVFGRPLLGERVLDAILLVSAAGFFGGIVDSVLGATLQVKYVSSRGETFEREPKHLGIDNYQRKGFKTINNDMVNAISSAVSVSLFALIYLFT